MINVLSFLSCFYQSNQQVCLRLLHDRKDPNYKAIPYTVSLDDFDKLMPQLKKLNSQNYGIFFSPNGARSDSEVDHISAQFYECDDISFAEQFEQIEKFPLKPSIIVKTRKSLHVYFLVKNAKVDSFRRIQQKLAAYFGGDRTVVNPSRIMRMPGFNHCKEDPIMVECYEFAPERIYTQEELEEILTATGEQIESESETMSQGGMDKLLILCEECDFIKYCKDTASAIREIDWYHMITNLAVFEGGKVKCHEFSRSYPGYSFSETEEKINHFIASKTLPVNCQTISEKGYKCPRLGKCKCKSPAGLPFTKTEKDAELSEWYMRDTKNKTLKFMPGVLAHYLEINIPSMYTSGMFYIYKDGVYNATSDFNAQKLVQDHLLTDKAKMADINDATNQWRLRIQKDIKTVNATNDFINLKNSLYNIFTKELLPHSPKFLSTIRINANYDDSAKCPQFLEFLNQVLEPSLITIVQQMFGYCLTLSIDSQKVFLLRGVARSGKSTLIKILENLVGDENISNVALQDLGERFKTAELFGKLINSFSDLPNRVMEESGIFKALVSGDLVIAERKGKDPFSFRSFAKLIYSANELPLNVGDKTDGFFRRLIILRFNKQIPENIADPKLLSRLLGETDGIMMWALEGLSILIKNNFRFVDTTETSEELYRYKYISNNVLVFTEEELEFGPHFSIERQRLYSEYRTCCVENGTKAMSKTRFNETMESEYGDRIKRQNDVITRRCIWKGVRLFVNIDDVIF